MELIIENLKRRIGLIEKEGTNKAEIRSLEEQERELSFRLANIRERERRHTNKLLPSKENSNKVIQ